MGIGVEENRYFDERKEHDSEVTNLKKSQQHMGGKEGWTLGKASLGEVPNLAFFPF